MVTATLIWKKMTSILMTSRSISVLIASLHCIPLRPINNPTTCWYTKYYLPCVWCLLLSLCLYFGVLVRAYEYSYFASFRSNCGSIGQLPGPLGDLHVSAPADFSISAQGSRTPYPHEVLSGTIFFHFRDLPICH